MDTAGANPVITQVSVGVGSVFDFATAGYIVINNTSNVDITFDMWCWGGGGTNANVPYFGNPARGAAGGASGNLTGDLVGNVSGNVTGNVTGNLTGNVSGNVNAGVVTATSCLS